MANLIRLEITITGEGRDAVLQSQQLPMFVRSVARDTDKITVDGESHWEAPLEEIQDLSTQHPLSTIEVYACDLTNCRYQVWSFSGGEGRLIEVVENCYEEHDEPAIIYAKEGVVLKRLPEWVPVADREAAND